MGKDKKASKREIDCLSSADELIKDKKNKKSKKQKKEKRKAQIDSEAAEDFSNEKKDRNQTKKQKKKSKVKGEDELDLNRPSKKEHLLRTEGQPNSDEKPIQFKSADTTTKSTQENNSTGWTDWSQSSFGGDSARKEKFLRLIGAKKSTSNSRTEPSLLAKKGLFGSLSQSHPTSFGTSSLSDQAQQKIQRDLEHQFEEGLKFKRNMQHGAKRGLGA